MRSGAVTGGIINGYAGLNIIAINIKTNSFAAVFNRIRFYLNAAAHKIVALINRRDPVCNMMVCFLDVVGNHILKGQHTLNVHKQMKKFFQQKIDEQNKRTEAEKLRDAQIKEALDEVHKYPEYRQQSIDIQKKLEYQIFELKEMHKDTVDRPTKMEESTKRRERN